MASSENSWRAQDAGHHNIGANRLTDPADCSTATYSDLEDVSCNHLGQIVSVDFFIIPTIRLRVLFVFLVLEHRRREVLHFNVTEHPTSAWVAQQIVEAFADRETPRYLIRDRDGVYGTEVPRRLKSMGIAEVLTAASKPLAERLRRALDRIDTTGVFESFHHSEQSTLEEGAGFIFPLLPPITPTSGAQQTMPN